MTTADVAADANSIGGNTNVHARRYLLNTQACDNVFRRQALKSEVDDVLLHPQHAGD